MNAAHHNGNLLTPPLASDMIALSPQFGTRFMLFVDTEEEFDWNAPFSRTGHGVTALPGLARGQAFFAAAGIRPIYLADYPIIESEEAAALLGQWANDDMADIGAHLHPWVNPPFVEKVYNQNSFPGSLSREVESAKLDVLCERMVERFGRRPIAYRAGRYGVGPNSACLLEKAGFRLDTSIRSRFDYRAQFGPNFEGLPLSPYWAGCHRSLVELPLSTAFIGLLRGGGGSLYRAAQKFRPLASLLARSHLLSRVPLTPEGVPVAAAIAAIDALIEEGVPVLNFSFHSPALEPGHTYYVRDEADRTRFYDWWDRVLTHLARRGIAPATLDQFLEAVPARQQACQEA